VSSNVVYKATLGELAEIPGSPYAYWVPQSLRDLFNKYPPLDRDVARQPKEEKIADVKQGLATADDLRFTRYWWEVPVDEIAVTREETCQGKKWVPFAKGGKPFYHDVTLVVNWGNDGEEIKEHIVNRYSYLKGKWEWVAKNDGFYFRSGLRTTRAQSWSRAAKSGRLAIAYMPKGVIWNDRSMAIIQEDEGLNESLLSLLFSRLQNTFVLLQSGEPAGEASHIASIPIINDALRSKRLGMLSYEAIDLLRQWDTGNETSTQFIAPWLVQIWHGFDLASRPVTGHPLAQDFIWSDWPVAEELRGQGAGPWSGQISLTALAQEAMRREGLIRQRLAEIECDIDKEVYRLYGISPEDQRMIAAELAQLDDTLSDEIEMETVEEAEPDSMTEATLDKAEHVKRLLHYLAHRVLAADPTGIVTLDDAHLPGGELKRGLVFGVRAQLAEEFGQENGPALEEEIRSIIGQSLEGWLKQDLFSYHLSLYSLRPIVWQLSSYGFAPRRRRGESVFNCFLYFPRLDNDTLYKVQQIYVGPLLAGSRQEAEYLAKQLSVAAAEPARLRRQREQQYQQALDCQEELEGYAKAAQELLAPHKPPEFRSRSAWVKDKVAEIVASGYRPNLDYGVRVNIEPLKQVGIMAREAERVRG
jgi:hypothetical protein